MALGSTIASASVSHESEISSLEVTNCAKETLLQKGRMTAWKHISLSQALQDHCCGREDTDVLSMSPQQEMPPGIVRKSHAQEGFLVHYKDIHIKIRGIWLDIS